MNCRRYFSQVGDACQIENYSCSYCGIKLKTLSAKNSHERIHTDVKLFGCKFCDLKFTEPQMRKNHERAHTLSKSYEQQGVLSYLEEF